jgi:hypothetical protein
VTANGVTPAAAIVSSSFGNAAAVAGGVTPSRANSLRL